MTASLIPTPLRPVAEFKFDEAGCTSGIFLVIGVVGEAFLLVEHGCGGDMDDFAVFTLSREGRRCVMLESL